MQALELGLDPDKPVTLCQITYRLKVSLWWDWDNAAASFKIVGDALQHAGVYVNDSQIDDLRILRGTVTPRQGSIVVQITGVRVPVTRKC